MTLRFVKPILLIVFVAAVLVVIGVHTNYIKIIPQETKASLGDISKARLGNNLEQKYENTIGGENKTNHSKEISADGEHGAHVHTLNINPVDAVNVGIGIEEAKSVQIKTFLSLPGEVRLNADKVCHIVPHVSGTVAETRKVLGESVKRGEIIAVIDSRELAEAKSGYLVHLKREELTRINFKRIENLWRKKVSPEKEYLDAKQKHEESKIERLAAAQKLFALGLSKEEINDLTKNPHMPMMRYHLIAPLDGTVIAKHMTRGEWIPQNRQILCVADLADVWVDVIVYPKYLGTVKIGQKATVKSDASGLAATGEVSYLGPILGEESRTAEARIVIPNPDRRWHPGLFVTVEILKGHKPANVAIQNEAIQYHKKQPVIFVPNNDHFEVRNVMLGARDKDFTEVIRGISPGEKYAAANSFALKAELERSGAVCGHSH